MSSNRTAWVALALAAACASASAAETRCPATQGGTALTGASLFDGPLSEHADLAPDSFTPAKGGGRSTWDVGYVSAAGRGLYIQCRYGKAELVLNPKSAQQCEYVSGPAGRNALTCR